MRPSNYKVAVTVVYVLGLFIQILDATIVNIALPTLSREFSVAITDVEWVSSATCSPSPRAYRRPVG